MAYFQQGQRAQPIWGVNDADSLRRSRRKSQEHINQSDPHAPRKSTDRRNSTTEHSTLSLSASGSIGRRTAKWQQLDHLDFYASLKSTDRQNSTTEHSLLSRSASRSIHSETAKSELSNLGHNAHNSSKQPSVSQARRIWLELPAWKLEFESLTPIQQQVMEYVASTSEAQSAAAKTRLKKAWGLFNVQEEDFSAIELYLAKKVPLTIRIDIQGLLPHLMSDPFYRTCFETNVKGSAYLDARREFEAVLFNSLYEHPSVQPKDRPKYGVLNMVCHPFSDSRVSMFGSAYLLLKDSLRARTTVATSKENLGFNIRRVGTLDNMWHIIETLSTHEVTRIHAVATGRRAKATVTPDLKYSEIQVHGMVDMRKDVAAIVVQRQDLQCTMRRSLIEDLSKLYLLPVLTCEELDESLGDRRWSTVVNQRANALLQKTMAMQGATFSSASVW